MRIKCLDCDGFIELSILASSRYCEQCKKERELERSFKEQSRLKAYRAYQKGIIIKSPCKRCGNPDTEMHHEDYENPLSVDWFCRKCHLSHHKRKRLYGIFKELSVKDQFLAFSSMAKILKSSLIEHGDYDPLFIKELDDAVKWSFEVFRFIVKKEDNLDLIKSVIEIKEK